MIKLTDQTRANKSGKTKYEDLSLYQRIVLNNGGCLTKLLEDLLEENLKLIKLEEQVQESTKEEVTLQSTGGCQVLNRKILLAGESSGANHIYAESTIILDHLDEEFSHLLMHSHIPIGKLWEKLKVETYKTLVAWGDEHAGALSLYFNIMPGDLLLYRTYLVYSHKKPVMMITEKFPQTATFQPMALPVSYTG